MFTLSGLWRFIFHFEQEEYLALEPFDFCESNMASRYPGYFEGSEQNAGITPGKCKGDTPVSCFKRSEETSRPFRKV